MSDDKEFTGFHKQAKGQGKGQGTRASASVGLTATGKQLFFRLQDPSPLTLTPTEKTALLDVYKKAYPAFYAKELANMESRSGFGGMVRHFFRGVALIGIGILIAVIVITVIKMILQ